MRRSAYASVRERLIADKAEPGDAAALHQRQHLVGYRTVDRHLGRPAHLDAGLQVEDLSRFFQAPLSAGLFTFEFAQGVFNEQAFFAFFDG